MQYKKSSIFMEDIKRAVANLGFAMGVAGLTIMLMRTVLIFGKTPGEVSVLEICEYPMALSGFTIFSAAFPAWAYASSFYKEKKVGYSYFILSRMSWKKYVSMRICSVGVSGFLIMAIPLAITFAYAYGIGAKEIGPLFEGMHVREVILELGLPAVLCIKICLGGLYGVFWALVGFLSAMLIKNKYAPYLIPFILNQFLWIVFSKIPKLNPVLLVRGEDLDSYGRSAGILLLYCIVAVVLNLLVFRRRVVQ